MSDVRARSWAVTGQVMLDGRVRDVGGLREKVDHLLHMAHGVDVRLMLTWIPVGLPGHRCVRIWLHGLDSAEGELGAANVGCMA